MPMEKIYPRLYIGDEPACRASVGNQDLAIIHACKEPCHRKHVGYKERSIPDGHPMKLTAEAPYNLYLNLVDMPQEFLVHYTHPIIEKAISFIKTHIQERSVLIHCNQGKSRSPSIGMAYLAHQGIIPNASFPEAEQAFIKIYDKYEPGLGIRSYLQKNWTDIMSF